MADKVKDRQRYNAPALEKGLDIIELLARQPTGLTQVEIARQLSRSVSQVYRMLVSLERRGYLHLDPDSDQYTLTLKLFELAHTYPPTKKLISAAMPWMEEIAQSTGQSCHLTVHRDGQVVVLAQVDGQEDMAFVVRAGAQFDLLSASSGYVLLAFQKPEDRVRMIEMRKAATGRVIPDTKAFEARVAAVLKSGYDQNSSMAVRGITNISFPVLGGKNTAMAALTITYLERIDQIDLPPVDAVREHLARITGEVRRSLGISVE